MNCVTPHAEGVVLAVKARPGSRRNEVRGVEHGQLKASVTAAAEKGKANAAICELLAEALGVKRSQVELLAGATSAEKRFLIRGAAVETLQQRIAEIAKGRAARDQ